jgi:DNA-binding transcriptional ArsR family regulator
MAVNALAHLGSLLADGTRASMLAVLMDGRARSAGELARLVGVAPSTASEHLSRLLDAHFVAVEVQGRHRYYRLAGPDVAHLLETLGAIDVPKTAHPGFTSNAPTDLLYARSCYDHLAGRLGVRIYDFLLDSGHLSSDDDHLSLTPSGRAVLEDLGVDVDAAIRATRATARSCLDWTERRHHLAGATGAALFDALLARRWLARGNRARSVRVTTAGQRGLAALLPSDADAGASLAATPSISRERASAR